jgi:ATP-binding cassette subfamily B protein
MAVLQAAQPLTIAWGIGIIAQHTDIYHISLVAGLTVIIGVGQWGLNWVRRQLTSGVVANVVASLRKDAFRKAMDQDLLFYDMVHPGDIISRITGDAEQFGESLLLGTDTINQLTFVLILVIVLLDIEWRLTLVVLAMGLAVIVAVQWFRHRARRATQQSARAIGEVNKSIQEAVTGIEVAKNFRQEQALLNEFRLVNDQACAINVRREWVINGIFPALQILTGASTAVIVYFGGLSASVGVISIASWYLFVVTIDRFWLPFSDLSAFWSQIQAGLASMERIFALMDSESTVLQIASHPVPSLTGAIELERISFRYTQQEQVFEDFSLHIAPGERLALVGHTGAGKSSLLKLIARLYEFQDGQLLIDGRDIRSLDLSTFRNHLGIISQAPFLRTGTIADNIRYTNPEATDADIETVASRIGNGDWLRAFPDGLQRNVGERGSHLSAGQRQLVALIRILLKNPSIFLLDEATANIDPFTESLIQEALGLLLKHRTSIIIAHRLSTIQSVDRIIVLQHGRIVEEGSHSILLRNGGQYADLYNMYFRHQSLDYQID